MVECILDSFPGVSSWQTDAFDNDRSTTRTITSCVLHCACYNKDCPGSVIKLLLGEYKAAAKCLATIGHGVHDWGVKGLPLHYYLTRISNIDVDIVKLLVEAYPQSLMITDETWPCYPIHAAVFNSITNNLSEIIEYFLELDPTSLRVLDGDGTTPLLLACENKGLDLEVVRMLYNSWPEALRMSGSNTNFPIHELCRNRMIEDTAALAILQFMLDIDQSISRERDIDGYLPIHHAVRGNSIEFCKALIDVYPESLRVRTNNGRLPIHSACCHHGNSEANIETVQYMLDIYPESINVRSQSGLLPIHGAVFGGVRLIELLLKHDPDAASKEKTDEDRRSRLPLHMACDAYADNVDVIETLYDAFPQAILLRDNNEYGQVPLECARQLGNSEVFKFLQAQLVYAQKDMTTMTTPDENGWLPLHHAFKDKAPLGSIKLLLNGNPSAIRTVDNQYAFPLHLACEFSSEKVVRYLVGESNKHIIGHLDTNKDSILHYACRGVNLEVIKYLVDSFASLVSNTNTDNKLPFHLLLECENEQVRESLEFTEVCFQMLRAHPETVTMQTSRKRRRD